MGVSAVKRKKKQTKNPTHLPNTLLASHPTRLSAPGCTSIFPQNQFEERKSTSWPDQTMRDSLGVSELILNSPGQLYKKKKKAVSQLLSFILKHFFHPVSYDKHFDCYSERNM